MGMKHNKMYRQESGGEYIEISGMNHVYLRNVIMKIQRGAHDHYAAGGNTQRNLLEAYFQKAAAEIRLLKHAAAEVAEKYEITSAYHITYTLLDGRERTEIVRGMAIHRALEAFYDEYAPIREVLSVWKEVK